MTKAKFLPAPSGSCGSRRGLEFSLRSVARPMRSAFVATLILCLLGLFHPFVAGAQAQVLRHEQDLLVAPNDGYGVFAWSPDSRHVAFATWSKNFVRVVNVETGAVTTALKLQEPTNALAWSPDGSLLAVNGLSELTVVRVSDRTITNTFNREAVSPDFYFGYGLAFSPDNKSVLLTPPATKDRDLQDILLYRFDLRTQSMALMLRSPLSGSYHVDSESRFTWYNGSLYYSSMLHRPQDERPFPDQPGLITFPSTCYVAKIGKDGTVTTFSRDFPPPTQPDALDGKLDIVECSYSPISNTLLVARRVPLYTDKSGVIVQEQGDGDYFEAIKVDDGSSFSTFGTAAPDSGHFDTRYFDVHPSHPWAVAQGAGYIVLWNFATGEALDRAPTNGLFKPQFSPDGTRKTYGIGRASMPIFAVISH